MRRFSALTLMALFAVVLSACGSSAPTTGTDATSATTGATTEATTTGATTEATTTGATTEATTTTGTSTTPMTSTDTMTGTTTTGATTEATTAATTAATTEATMTAPTVATTGTITSTTGVTTTGDAATDDLIAAATANGNLTTLLTAIQTAGLEEQLKGVGPYTLFAPTDQAFASLPSGVLTALLADPTKLGSILSYHVANGSLKAADVAKLTSIPTLEGQSIKVSTNGTMVMLNDNTMITTTDIVTTNGVIHVIDKVLIPSDVTLPAS